MVAAVKKQTVFNIDTQGQGGEKPTPDEDRETIETWLSNPFHFVIHPTPDITLQGITGNPNNEWNPVSLEGLRKENRKDGFEDKVWYACLPNKQVWYARPDNVVKDEQYIKVGNTGFYVLVPSWYFGSGYPSPGSRIYTLKRHKKVKALVSNWVLDSDRFVSPYSIEGTQQTYVLHDLLDLDGFPRHLQA